MQCAYLVVADAARHFRVVTKPAERARLRVESRQPAAVGSDPELAGAVFQQHQPGHHRGDLFQSQLDPQLPVEG